ncbi:hypothetical protein ACF0H5_017485 [Mactra antiquata]
MVRLDKCVEALYDDSVTNDNRNKNLQILNVMKGAISMSRSKTGECIFRTNKTEKKNLERFIVCEGRNSNYNIAQIDSKKKQVLLRWSKVLEQQTMCSSETLFEELMEINQDDSDLTKLLKPQTPEHEDGKLRNLINLRLSAIDKETNKGTYVPVLPARLRLAHKVNGVGTSADETEADFVTVDKQIRDKYHTDVPKGDEIKSEVLTTEIPVEDVHSKTKLVHLPVIRQEAKVSKSPEPSPRFIPMERDHTDWGNWALKDKTWIKGYLHREKTRHEDLIIRNALNRIESDMSGANMIRRQQMRQKLQQERQQREAEVRQYMRAQRNSEESSEVSPSPRLGDKAESPGHKSDTMNFTNGNKQDIVAEDETTHPNTQLSKTVNFDDQITVFEIEKRSVPSKRRTRKARGRSSLETNSKVSLPSIPENVRVVKQGTRSLRSWPNG